MNSDFYTVLDYEKDFFNVGDYIQSLAVIESLKRGGVEKINFAQRENLAYYTPLRVIMQGWFARSDGFIPNKFQKPLYVGFHLRDALAKKDILQKIVRQKRGAIGCRDLRTLSYFGDRGYFSRCLTLTFDKIPRPAEPKDVIVACYTKESPADEFLRHLPPAVLEQARILTHRDGAEAGANRQERFVLAKERLQAYAQAKLVITNLLHCALPCVAMGVPVVFVNDFCADIRSRRTALAGILPVLKVSDLKNLNYEAIPVVNIDKLKVAMRENFRLSFLQAFGGGEFKDVKALADAREEIRAFISDEYYNFL